MNLYLQMILAGVAFGVGASLPFLVVLLVTRPSKSRTLGRRGEFIDSIINSSGAMACSSKELKEAIDGLEKAKVKQKERWADLSARIDVAGQDFAQPTPENLEHAFRTAIARPLRPDCMFMASLPSSLR